MSTLKVILWTRNAFYTVTSKFIDQEMFYDSDHSEFHIKNLIIVTVTCNLID